MAARDLEMAEILKAVNEFAQQGITEVSSSQLKDHVAASQATLKRHLDCSLRCSVQV